MITVKIQVDTKVYTRLPGFKEKMHENLKQQAIEIANGEELDWSTAKYMVIGLNPSSKCGCSKRSDVILTVNHVGE